MAFIEEVPGTCDISGGNLWISYDFGHLGIESDIGNACTGGRAARGTQYGFCFPSR